MKTLLAILSLTFSIAVEAQSILTVVGGGRADGRPATLSSLHLLGGVAYDAEGNLYLAEELGDRVVRIEAESGILTTFAGTGTPGFSGDGGPALEAGLSQPIDVAVDEQGHVYISDFDNNRIRRVDLSSGIITTIAGNGELTESGDGGPATLAGLGPPGGLTIGPDGDLYVAAGSRIRRIDRVTHVINTVAGNGTFEHSGDGGPATSAGLSPFGVAVAADGTVFIADANSRIRRVDATTGIITTIAGTGETGSAGDGGLATEATLSWPWDVELDSAENIYIADFGASVVRRISRQNGVITTAAGNGSGMFSGDGEAATEAGISPGFLAFSPDGDLTVSDINAHRVRRISSSTGVIETIAGGGNPTLIDEGGPATSAILQDGIWGVAAGRAAEPYRLIIATGAHLRAVDAEGNIRTIAGNGSWDSSDDTTSASESGMSPAGVTLSASGDIYFADQWNHRVRTIEKSTGLIRTVAGNGIAGYSGDGGPAVSAGLSNPEDVAVDELGNIYITDSGNHRVRRVNSRGIIETVAGTGVPGLSGDGGLGTMATLHHPSAVTVDSDGDIYFSDYRNNVIRKVDQDSGVITTVAGNGTKGFSGDGGPATAAQLYQPVGVAVDHESNLVIGDYFNNRIRRVASGTGLITTIAGTGEGEGELRGVFTGDGGPATAAGISAPIALSVDDDGNIYVSDFLSSRIRMISGCLEVTPSTLISPLDRSTGLAREISLSWAPVDGAFRYDLYLDTLNPPERVVAENIAGTSFAVANLDPLTIYYWSVQVTGDPYCAPVSRKTSIIWSFTTQNSCELPTNR